MKCAFCNNEIKNTDKFCSSCGKEISNDIDATKFSKIEDYKRLETFNCRIRENRMFYNHYGYHRGGGFAAPLMNAKIAIAKDSVLIDFNDGNVDKYPFSAVGKNNYYNGPVIAVIIVFFVIFISIAFTIAASAFNTGFNFFGFIPLLFLIPVVIILFTIFSYAGKAISINSREHNWCILFNSTKDKQDFENLINTYR